MQDNEICISEQYTIALETFFYTGRVVSEITHHTVYTHRTWHSSTLVV